MKPYIHYYGLRNRPRSHKRAAQTLALYAASAIVSAALAAIGYVILR